MDRTWPGRLVSACVHEALSVWSQTVSGREGLVLGSPLYPDPDSGTLSSPKSHQAHSNPALLQDSITWPRQQKPQHWSPLVNPNTCCESRVCLGALSHCRTEQVILPSQGLKLIQSRSPGMIGDSEALSGLGSNPDSDVSCRHPKSY